MCSSPDGVGIGDPLVKFLSGRVILTSAAAATDRASGLPPHTVTESKPLVADVTWSATNETKASSVR